MRLLGWLGGLFVGLLVASSAAAAAIPGPQRALCPQCFGLEAIGQDIFTDQPGRRHELEALVAAADHEIASFYGPLSSHPRFVFCGTPSCLASFGGGATGITYGAQLIRIAPNGFRAAIVTHERLHAEIAARMGWQGLWSEPVPIWFSEGLATYLAGDDRFNQPYSPADQRWIEAGVTRAQWNRLLAERDWIAGYGAATAAVATIDRKIGHQGLRRLLERVAAGEAFDTVLADLFST